MRLAEQDQQNTLSISSLIIARGVPEAAGIDVTESLPLYTLVHQTLTSTAIGTSDLTTLQL